jgi:hypothetical protein
VRKALLIGTATALVCIGVSVLILIGVHERTVHHNSRRAIQVAKRVVSLVKEGRVTPVLPKNDAEAIQVVDAHGMWSRRPRSSPASRRWPPSGRPATI